MYSEDDVRYEPLPLPDRLELSDEDMEDAVEGFYEMMKARHTVRDYSDRPVDEDVIAGCIRIAGTAPSGANHQPWHFVAISDPEMKSRIRKASEDEEEKFYAGGAGDEWLKALEPIGTGVSKPHLDKAPWLIVIFAQRYGTTNNGTRYKNYYVPESVGIASGFLLTALHMAGLVSLTHTPNPMKFLNEMCGRPASEKPIMIVAVGHPAEDAVVPSVAKIKKPLSEILTTFRKDD
ncbi:nitroreductase family protein [Cochlodiniinecator piscidefendens]|uniref:nitroreductase family protein n=1 Tax=Cochlodiniinecator piscidefendens TaxID=2715756 RepID=UPI00140A622C|nr:nitroreductase family protein [Cochlodiniinecator piscidefendens]